MSSLMPLSPSVIRTGIRLIRKKTSSPCKYTAVAPVHSDLFWNTERCTATFTSAFGLVDHLQLQCPRRVLTQKNVTEEAGCLLTGDVRWELRWQNSSLSWEVHGFLILIRIIWCHLYELFLRWEFKEILNTIWILINSCSIQQLWSCRWCYYTHCETSICVSQLAQMQNVISAAEFVQINLRV